VIKLIIEKGADVNTKNTWGETALELAPRNAYQLKELLRKHMKQEREITGNK